MVEFRVPLASLPGGANRESTLALAISNAIRVVTGISTSVTVAADEETGFVRASVSLQDGAQQAALETYIRDGNVTIIYPALIGEEYTAFFPDDAGPCLPGSVSQTGDRNTGEGCTSCRANTYSNNAQTICAPCPTNTFAQPGSSDVRDCRPQDAGSTDNPFNLGDDWFGDFSSPCPDDSDELCDGQLELEVVAVSGADVRFLATFTHGHFCDISLQCRIESAGVSQFYLEGTASGDSMTAQYVAGTTGWAGITDRSFVREALSGTVTNTQAGVEFQGKYGDRGAFDVVRRCRVPKDGLPFSAGDRWVGAYECERVLADGSKPREGEVDVRRMEVTITTVAPSGKVQALVDLDYLGGTGQYAVDGVFDGSSACQAAAFTPTAAGAWQTPQPSTIAALELSGRLTAGGEAFEGLVALPSACRCLGRSPQNDATRGASCDFWGEDEKWCYVGEGCAGASAQAKAPGFYRFACGPFPVCSAVELTRVCPAGGTVCDHGYTAFGARCYKAVAAAASFANAEAACADEDGHLASLHNAREETFVRQLGGAGSWLGLRREGSLGSFEWTDGSLFASAGGALGYNNWTAGEPDGRPGDVSTEACASLGDGGWEDGPCGTARPYVCKKQALGVNASCACTGQRDAKGHGATCSAWDEGAPDAPWCYVSKNCPRAVPADNDPNAKLWRHYCAVSFSTTAPLPATDEPCDEGEYRRDDGACTACTTADDCLPSQTLVGECAGETNAVCVNCDPSCATCDGLGPGSCLTCAAGRVRAADGSACLAQCPGGQFAKPPAAGGAGERQCAACSAACAACSGTADTCTACPPGGDTFLRTSDSACVAAAACPAGTFASTATQTCAACSTCSGGSQYISTPCSATADASCDTLTTCAQGTQYEFTAPTATSDRVCRTLTPCRPGQFEAAAATSTSDRQCSACPAGTSDVGANNTCVECSAGSFMPAGSVGECTLCALGTFDDDGLATTPCKTCPDGTYADSRGAQSCASWKVCGAGQQQAQTPTRLRDRICVACTNGTFRTAAAGEGTLCQAWKTCAAGAEPNGAAAAPSATSDRQCQQCQPNFYKAQAGNFPCAAAASCPPGSEEEAAPTATSDRQCRTCSSGTYSPSGLACVALTTCDAASQFQTVAPTSSADRQCGNLTVCDTATQFVSIPARADRDRQCSPLRACDSDEYEERAPQLSSALSPPQYVSDRRCAACSTCPAGQTPAEECSAAKDTVCQDCSGCGEGRYYAQPCTSALPGQCADCDVCTAAQFEEQPCTRNAGRVCKALTQCTLGASYQQVPPTAISDRVCAPVTTCADDEIERAAPTLTSDRVCGVCTEGLEYKQDGRCVPAEDCKPGFEERRPPTTTSDRSCRACPAGHFKAASGQAACTLGTECALGEIETAALTPTSDRTCRRCDPAQGEYSDTRPATACKTVSACPAGTEIELAATSQADQKCSACAAGTFAASADQDACTPWTECAPGEGVSPAAAAPSATSDRVCVPCVAGSNYTAQADQPCRAVKVCPAGTEQAAAPTASSDRTCRDCVAGFTFRSGDADAGTPCQSASLCKAGEAEAAGPTTSTDRQCDPCPSGTFRAVPGIGPCQPHSAVCAAGTRQAQAPSIFNDRTCEACDPAAGEYQDVAGRLVCKAATVCRPGERVTAPLTASQDRGCAPCAPGTFSDSDNSAACTACQVGSTYQDLPGQVRCLTTRTCGIGQEERGAPTATSDRQCTSCDGVETYLSSRGCVPVTQCGPNTVVVAEPNPLADRVCTCIDQQSYQPGTGPFDAARGCAPVTRCTAAQEEFISATLRRDRVCVRPGDIGLQVLGFDNDFAQTLPDASAEDSFVAALLATVASLPGLQNRGLHFKATLSAGSIMADVRLTDKAAAQDLRDAAEAGDVAFMWPASGPTRQQYVAYPVGKANPDSSNDNTGGGGGDGGDNTAVIIGVVAAVAILAIAFIAFLALRRRGESRNQRVELPDVRNKPGGVALGGGMSRADAYHNPLYDESGALHAGLASSDHGYVLGSSGGGDDDEAMYQDMGGDDAAYANGYADLGPVSATGTYDNVGGGGGGYMDVAPPQSGYLDVAPPATGASGDAGVDNGAGYMDVGVDDDDNTAV